VVLADTRARRAASWFGALALSMLASGLAAPPAGAQEVWFGPADPLSRSHMVPPPPPNDWSSLWSSTTQWPFTVKHITEFRMTALYALTASDADVQTVLAFLVAHNIKLAVQVYANYFGANGCGLGMESYEHPNEMLLLAQRISQLGGTIDAAVMDEPLWYGHEVPTLGTAVGCLYSIDQVAASAATNIQQMRSVFPQMRIGEIEPVVLAPTAPISQAQRNADLQTYLAAFAAAMGTPHQLFQADVSWKQAGWPAALQSYVTMLQVAGIPWGIVYDGRGNAATDAIWISQAKKAYAAVDTLGLAANQIVFDVWMPHPQNNLPEKGAPTLTSLVRTWILAHPTATPARSVLSQSVP
jgi:hypothetical protein